MFSHLFKKKKSFLFLSVREPDGGLKLYCKGADIVILERLQKDCPYQESTEKALEVKYCTLRLDIIRLAPVAAVSFHYAYSETNQTSRVFWWDHQNF